MHTRWPDDGPPLSLQSLMKLISCATQIEAIMGIQLAYNWYWALINYWNHFCTKLPMEIVSFYYSYYALLRASDWVHGGDAMKIKPELSTMKLIVSKSAIIATTSILTSNRMQKVELILPNPLWSIIFLANSSMQMVTTISHPHICCDILIHQKGNRFCLCKYLTGIWLHSVCIVKQRGSWADRTHSLFQSD